MKFCFHASCPPDFVRESRKYLLHRRGWNSKKGHSIRESCDDPGVIIHCLSAKEMQKKYGRHEHLRGLSVTDSRGTPIIIDIHAGNWYSPPAKFKGTTSQYRAYLINHEMGHALGYGHVELGEGKCQLMAQQSKGTAGCSPNGFPN
jgi:hypothetical protein